MSVSTAVRSDPSIDVSAVLVSYNTRELTVKAITALKTHSGRSTLEILIVDNASTDGTAEQIANSFPEINLIANECNRGFGAANNQAMRAARGKYLLLINSDAFVHAGALDAMLYRMESEPGIGVVGPRLMNTDGSVQQSCFAFPSPTHAWLENLWLSKFKRQHAEVGNFSTWAHDTPQEVDWVSGACILVRRECFDTVGGFDERFFMYSEETDWQWRMRKHGVRIFFDPKAVVTHLGGASHDSTTEKSRPINRHFFESLDYYELKNHGWNGLISFRLAMLVGCSLRAVLWTAAWLMQPQRRSAAVRKIRLHTSLVIRQLTSWHLSQISGTLGGGPA